MDLRYTLTNTLRKKLQLRLVRAVCFHLEITRMVIGIMGVRVCLHQRRKVGDYGIYKEVTIRYNLKTKYLTIHKISQYFCPTEVHNTGYEKLHGWGWCGEGCPLLQGLLGGHDDSIWGTDETLTVTTYNESDIYIAIAILAGTFISIPLIGIAVKRYGLYFIEYDV